MQMSGGRRRRGEYKELTGDHCGWNGKRSGTAVCNEAGGDKKAPAFSLSFFLFQSFVPFLK